MFDLEKSVDDSFSTLVDYLSTCGHEDNAIFIRNIMFDMALYCIVTEKDFDFDLLSDGLQNKLDSNENTNDVITLELLTTTKTLIIDTLRNLGVELTPDIELRELSIFVSGIRELVTSEPTIVSYYSTYLDDDMTTARETLAKILEVVTSYDFFGNMVNVTNGYIDDLRTTLNNTANNVENTDIDLLYRLGKLVSKIGFTPDTQLTRDIADNKDINGSAESLIKEFYVRLWRRKLNEYSTKDDVSEAVTDLIVVLWLCANSYDITTTYTTLIKQNEYEFNSKYPFKKFDLMLREEIAELRLLALIKRRNYGK